MIDNHGIFYEFFLMNMEVEVGSRVKSVADTDIDILIASHRSTRKDK
jgi:hypothetical protein